jgi:2-keto-3-deoxy-L-fuconate dehydrogenase
MSDRFVGNAVIVTGGARGIGRAIVDAFIAEGARVMVADVLADRLKTLEGSGDARIHTYEVDLSDFEATKEMTRTAIRTMGRVDVLVNCAGAMPDGPFLDVTQETFDRTFAVNARAPIATMQVAVPNMIDNGGGAIVNIASANAFKNESPESVYNASKAALVAITKAVAHEHGHLGIRANCVAPGQTLTAEGQQEIETDDTARRIQREYLARVPLRRVGRAHEQAAAVLFLASEEASFISGQTLIVDGGELGGGDWYDLSLAPPVPDDGSG